MERRKWLALALASGLLWAPDAWARSLRMLESTPQAEAYIDGKNAQYAVRFDGPVDHLASRLWIVRDGKVVETLPVFVDAEPDVLFGTAPQLSPGHYELRWSAQSAPDGEVTAGQIGFTVRP